MGLERGWVHRTPYLSALSYRFAVRTDNERLGRQVDALLAGLRDPVETAPVEHWYSLTAADGARSVPSTCGATARNWHAASGPATPWGGSCGM